MGCGFYLPSAIPYPFRRTCDFALILCFADQHFKGTKTDKIRGCQAF